MTKSFAERVYAVVRSVPRGRIVSYGGVAAMLGHPRAARGVGTALRNLPEDADVPWWRVVNRNAEITIRGKPGQPDAHVLQRELLQKEGVRFNRDGRSDWKKYGWTPDDDASDSLP
jgi:methylated-DNA-protein-cysteine methyltransferase-like protein